MLFLLHLVILYIPKLSMRMESPCRLFVFWSVFAFDRSWWSELRLIGKMVKPMLIAVANMRETNNVYVRSCFPAVRAH